jgi:hypothetical protein
VLGFHPAQVPKYTAFAQGSARDWTDGPAILEAIRRHVGGHAQFDDMALIGFGRT